MTVHQLLVLYTGAAFMLAGLLVLVMWKVLGPTYSDRLTVGWRLRSVVFTLGVSAVIRGVTIMFPGRLVAVEHMSPVMPPWATVCLVAAGAVAEFITSHRLPPPIMHRFAQLFAAQRSGEIAALMAAHPAAPVPGDVPFAPSPRFSSPLLRKVVLAGAGAGLLLLLGCVLHAAAATLPAA